MGNTTKKSWKEKIKMVSEDVSDLLEHGIQGSLEKTKKKYGDPKRHYDKKRHQGGWKD